MAASYDNESEVLETVKVEHEVDSLQFVVKTRIYHTQNVKI